MTDVLYPDLSGNGKGVLDLGSALAVASSITFDAFWNVSHLHWGIAVQAAIDYAIANNIHEIKRGSIMPDNVEMWCDVWNGGSYFTSGRCLYVADFVSLSLDFGNVVIQVRGPTGNADTSVGQVANVTPGVKWRGGWMNISGHDDCKFFELKNVHVKGAYAGGRPANILGFVQADNAISLIDRYIKKFRMVNVECEKFYGEIAILANSKSTTGATPYHELVNCHFHDGAFTALNPTSPGRSVFRNVWCGNASGVESVGGEGQVWDSACRFYNMTNCYMQAGPDPDYIGGYRYSHPIRRTDEAPPMIVFQGMTFENVDGTQLPGWARGVINSIDSPIGVNGDAVDGVDLVVNYMLDRVGGRTPMTLQGPLDLTTPTQDTTQPTYVQPPKGINIRVNVSRSGYAVDNNLHLSGVLRVYGGLYDYNSIRFVIDGENDVCQNGNVWDLFSTIPANFGLPRIDVLNPDIGGWFPQYLAISAHTAIKPASMGLALDHQTAATTYNITLDLTYSYAHGQQFILYCANFANNPDRVLALAKNGAGMFLNADRNLRRQGERVVLQYDRFISEFVEVGILDQGP